MAKPYKPITDKIRHQVMTWLARRPVIGCTRAAREVGEQTGVLRYWAGRMQVAVPSLARDRHAVAPIAYPTPDQQAAVHQWMVDRERVGAYAAATKVRQPKELLGRWAILMGLVPANLSAIASRKGAAV